MKDKKGKNDNSLIIAKVLALIVMALILIFIVRLSFDSTPTVSFTSFFQYLEGAPNVSISYVQYLSITGDWGFLDGLRTFLNIIMTCFNVFLWFCRQVLNTLRYLLYFVRFIFV